MRQRAPSIHRSPHRSSHGWTLVELLVVMTLLALLLTLAVPSLHGMLQRQRQNGLSAQLLSDLHYLRNSTMARQMQLRLRVQSHGNGTSCYLIHTGSADACGCDTSGQVRCNNGAELLREVVLGPETQLQWQANSASMLVDPRLGTFTPAGSIELRGPDVPTLRHVVSLLGRVRLCSPDGGSRAGVPEC